ncbi:MAG: sigma-70 family RNA polymerase sigma factor [Planctomycetota bacterium]
MTTLADPPRRQESERIAEQMLVLDAQGGGRAAIDSLVRHWQDRLYRHAYRLNGRADLAADVTQDAWIAILRSLPQLRDPACFPRWAYRVVTGKSADLARKRTRRRRTDTAFAVDNDDLSREPAPDAGLADEKSKLKAAVTRLPPGQRVVLEMHYLDGLSVGDIAAALDLPPGTIKSRLYHAREKLRGILGPPPE